MREVHSLLCPSQQEYTAMIARRSLFTTLGLALGLTAAASASALAQTTPKKKAAKHTAKKKKSAVKKPLTNG